MAAANTVQYFFPVLASLVNNTLTAMTGITIDLPESGKVFKSVLVEVTCDDIITATGGSTSSRRIDLGVNGVAATTVNNTTTIANSGENLSWHFSADFTAQFTSNYTGTSHAVACSVLINQSTGTTLNLVNVVVSVTITYEYNPGASMIKTIYYPLNAPVAALATSKPGSATATIPNCDTEFPEATKVYKQIYLIIEGNTAQSDSTDVTLSTEVDTLGVNTSSAYEGALVSDRKFRYVVDWTSLFTKNATHSFYIWGSVARLNHLQVTMMVTYTFDEKGTTSVYHSIKVPVAFESLGGFITSADYVRGFTDFYLPEPGTITTKALAAYMNMSGTASATGMQVRLGTGSFVAYTAAGGGARCGSMPFMIRNDSAYTLARGNNAMSVDFYATSPSVVVAGLSGYILICYTSARASAGTSIHSRTILHIIATHGTLALTSNTLPNTYSPTAFVIPQVDYYIQNMALLINAFISGTYTGTDFEVEVEEVTGDPRGAHGWRKLITPPVLNDTEAGSFVFTSRAGLIFKRWPNDIPTDRLLHSTTRKWRTYHYNLQALETIQQLCNYHAHAYTIQGTLTNSAGGTVNLYLHDALTGELLKTSSRVGNGAFSFDWYDTRSVFVRAYESSTKKGVSIEGAAEEDTFSLTTVSFNSVTSFVESPAGVWTATGDSGYDIDTPNYGVDTVNTLPANTDGFCQFEYDANTFQNGAMIFKDSSTLTSWSNSSGVAGVRIYDDGGTHKPQCINIGVANVIIPYTLVLNDLLRIKREGANFFFDTSSDAGVTWIRRHTFIKTDSTEVWAFGYASGGTGSMNKLYYPKLGLPAANTTQFNIDLQPTGGGGGTRYYAG